MSQFDIPQTIVLYQGVTYTAATPEITDIDGIKYYDFYMKLNQTNAGQITLAVDEDECRVTSEYCSDGMEEIQAVLLNRLSTHLFPEQERVVTKDNITIDDLNKEFTPPNVSYDLQALTEMLAKHFKVSKGKMQQVSKNEVLFKLYQYQKHMVGDFRQIKSQQGKGLDNMWKLKINQGEGISITFTRSDNGVYVPIALMTHDRVDGM